MSSPIRPVKDLDPMLMYAPAWAREKPSAAPVAAADEPPIERPPQSLAVDAVGPTFTGDLAVQALRLRPSLDPEMVPEPKPLKETGSGS